MANNNTENVNARSGRAVTDDQPAQDGAHATRGQEPKSYTAEYKRDASLATPAAGEMSDYADEGPASGGMQQGGTNTNAPHMKSEGGQGAKTQAKNKEILQAGDPGVSER